MKLLNGFVLEPHAASGLLSWTKVGWSGPSQSHQHIVFAWRASSPPPLPPPFSSSLRCAVPGQDTLKG